MWKKTSLLCVFVVLAAMTSSCIFDPDKGTNDDPPPPSDYLPLNTKVAVLKNLETSYNNRNITEYEKILDDNFTFFLAAGDVGGGLPVQWDRAEELDANTHLFSRTPDPNWPLCTSIDMNLQIPDDPQWLEIIPSAAPDEVWQTTTLFYDFQIEVAPDTKYIPVPGAKAQFTVRNAGTDAKPHWQLIEWRDLGGGN
jgi:hypothetical protein